MSWWGACWGGGDVMDSSQSLNGGLSKPLRVFEEHTYIHILYYTKLREQDF